MALVVGHRSPRTDRQKRDTTQDGGGRGATETKTPHRKPRKNAVSKEAATLATSKAGTSLMAGSVFVGSPRAVRKAESQSNSMLVTDTCVDKKLLKMGILMYQHT